MAGNHRKVTISLEKQKLTVLDGEVIVDEFDVSTAANGGGEKADSECTPRGLHRICEKIGENCRAGTVFVARQPTGEIYSDVLKERFPDRDWILTRILRLGGTEEGINKGDDVDTLSRMIYIHGSPDSVEMGVPGSHGCIRMRNPDVIRLFDMVETGTLVEISD